MQEINAETAAQVASFIRRAEAVNEEIKGLQDDRKDIFKEAKSLGYNVTALKNVLKRRKAGEDAAAEMDSLVATYERAIQYSLELGDTDKPKGAALLGLRPKPEPEVAKATKPKGKGAGEQPSA